MSRQQHTSELRPLWRRLPVPRSPDWTVPATQRRLSRRLYLGVVGGGVALTALQVLTLPRSLGTRGFGTIVIGISVTQGVLLLGDFGFARLADDSTKPHDLRNRWRSSAMAATAATTAVVVAVCAVLLATDTGPHLATVAALCALTGYLLTPLKLGAGACEARGDEVAAALYHLVWQNFPKVGLVAGAVIGRTPTWSAAGGLIAAAVVGGVRGGRIDVSEGRRQLLARLAPAWISPVSLFVVGWAGTYSIGAVSGLSAAGRYDFDLRVFLATTYLYYPFASVLTSRVNSGDHDAPRRATIRGAAIVTVAVAAAMVVLPLAQRRVVGFSALPLPVLAMLGVLALGAMVTYLMAATLIAYGRLWPTVAASLAAGGISLVGQLTISPVFGPIGAASVTAGAAVVSAVMQTISVRAARRAIVT